MKKIIQINFDKINKYDERLVIKFTMQDEEGKYVLDENYESYHINMAKAYDKWYNKEELTKFEKILLIMMLEEKEELLKVSKGDKELELMVRKIFEESEDPNIIGLYDKDEMNAWMMDVAKEVAKEEGIEQGIEQGQNEKSIEIAKSMIKDNESLDKIAKYTGLSLEEVENLKID